MNEQMETQSMLFEKGLEKKKPNFKKRQKYRFFLIAEKLKCG